MQNVDFINAAQQNQIEFLKEKRLAHYTSFHIGGDADYIVKPTDIAQLKAVVQEAIKANIPYCFLGNGSNVLAEDYGYRGVVILTCAISNMSLIKERNIIECQSGASLSRLCNFASEKSLSGIEFAFGIPGTVGGAIYMNAGAYGGEIKDCLRSCKYLDEKGEVVEIFGEQLDLSYRHSFFSDKKLFIISGNFAFKADLQSDIKARMDDFFNRRKTKQPLEFPSGGSTFKRPQNGYASQLIDECGLKGYTIGGAEVSKKHAGFIINKNNATAKDVLALIEYVKAEVKAKKGIELDCEIKRLS